MTIDLFPAEIGHNLAPIETGNDLFPFELRAEAFEVNLDQVIRPRVQGPPILLIRS